MPAEGIKYVQRKELLSYEEMLRLVTILVEMGITKVRITGGEPFVRRDLMGFLTELTAIEGLEAVNITTNGVLTKPFIPKLKEIGISSVNLSIDSLDRDRFFNITRRDELPKVLKSLNSFQENAIVTKLNAVVMDGQNIDDILPLVAYTKEHPVEVRFIEEMPFNGKGKEGQGLVWNHQQILTKIKTEYPDIQQVEGPPSATAVHYQIPGHAAKIGIIAAFSRTFCGSCNRIRLTAQGLLKTCLYDEGVLDIRNLMRNGASDAELKQAFLSAFNQRPKNGFEAEQNRTGKPVHESMSTIGG